MKLFTVTAFFTNGRRDFYQTFKLEEARAMFDQWKADIQSVYVSIS